MMSRGRGQCCSFLRMPIRRDWCNGVVRAEGEDVAKAETDGDVEKGYETRKYSSVPTLTTQLPARLAVNVQPQ